MSAKTLNLTLRVWRQKKPEAAGQFVTYKIDKISPDSSFLEMMDLLNEQLIEQGDEPVAFDHDCREGICGMCSMTINGVPHGKNRLQTTCQLHMRSFSDGDTITIEPFRAKPFPVMRDLVVDRTPLDSIIQSGGYITQRVGSAEDANAVPISKTIADKAMDAAACIGCGACVAVCPNASAMLFTSAKMSQLNMLPQGKPEKDRRALHMVQAMDDNGFGNCTNIGECEAACPVGISLDFIAMMNRDYAVAKVKKIFSGAA
ncbi:MAG: succinate dehydrogenase/fumarate reductase iron-sulfur subunit [Opitutales bacterium]|nr:succinate dehydrogenase/fumarate reductase iron-sulfur subunit [Opitutales bacterium]